MFARFVTAERSPRLKPPPVYTVFTNEQIAQMVI